MSPLARSPVLSALARTRFPRQTVRQFRMYADNAAVRGGAAQGQAAWGAQWKKVGGSFMM